MYQNSVLTQNCKHVKKGSALIHMLIIMNIKFQHTSSHLSIYMQHKSLDVHDTTDVGKNTKKTHKFKFERNLLEILYKTDVKKYVLITLYSHYIHRKITVIVSLLNPWMAWFGLYRLLLSIEHVSVSSVCVPSSVLCGLFILRVFQLRYSFVLYLQFVCLVLLCSYFVNLF